MDDLNSSLVGMHGYCTQEMVNLLLTGKASSNVFDGEKKLDDLVLKGIYKQTVVGYLTTLEKFANLEVGKWMKEPQFPVWVLYMESHFTVMFALDKSAILKDSFDIFLYLVHTSCG
jgi:hypothetical protein